MADSARNSIRDLRLAVRTLRRAPAFTFLSILTIALGIGASTAVFGMVNGALIKPLPYASDKRLVRIAQANVNNPSGGISPLEVTDYRQAKSFEGMAEYHSMPFQFYGVGEPQRVQTGVVSDNFFKLLGVRPLIGRDFIAGEDSIGAPNVILLSYKYWQRAFNGDSSVLGSKFTMNDRVGTIVGVLPPLPVYPDDNDIWMPAGQCPFRSAPTTQSNRRARLLNAFAVIRPNVSHATAHGELESISRRLHEAYPEAYPAQAKLAIKSGSVRDELTTSVRPLLYTLLASAVFVLIIAAANFANLTLSRQLRRRTEFALRVALGAGRSTLFRQLAIESLTVTTAGALAGIGVAYAGIGLLRSFATSVSARSAEVTVDPFVLTFAVVTSVVVGLVAALTPLSRASAPVSNELRSGAASTTSNARDSRTRQALVALQVAVAFVALAGAGLMVRSLVRLQASEGGFQTSNVLTGRIDLNWSRYTNRALTNDFASQLLQRLSELPGAMQVAVSSDFPLNTGVPGSTAFRIRSSAVDAAVGSPTSDVTIVSPDYFNVIGVPLVSGRFFNAADRDSANIPALVSKRLAATYWKGRDPIGDQVSFDNGTTWSTIVGIVGDVQQNGPAQRITDEIYLPFASTPVRDMRVLVRTNAAPTTFAAPLRTAVRAIDDRQPIVQVQTLEELRGARLTQPRITTLLLGVFAVISLIITASGLGGIVASAVAQRTNEIGIRLALGASRTHILFTVMRDSAIVIGVGLVVGVGIALASAGLIRGLLFDIAPTDVMTYAGVSSVLFGIGAVACLIPARRALRVSVIQSLRGG